MAHVVIKIPRLDGKMRRYRVFYPLINRFDEIWASDIVEAYREILGHDVSSFGVISVFINNDWVKSVEFYNAEAWKGAKKKFLSC